MKKRTLFILLVVLTLVFAFFTTTVTYAEDAQEGVDDGIAFTQSDLIKLIVTYCAFGLSIVVGIPAIRAVNKRKKHGYIDDIVRETAAVADKLKELSAEHGKSDSKRKRLKYALKITAVADMSLTTYTERQNEGYFEIYNELNVVKSRLTEIDDSKGDKDVGQEFAELIAAAGDIAIKAKTLADNESIISNYNK